MSIKYKLHKQMLNPPGRHSTSHYHRPSIDIDSTSAAYLEGFVQRSAINRLPSVPRSRRKAPRTRLTYHKTAAPSGKCCRRVFHFMVNLSASQLFAFNMVPVIFYCILYGTVVWLNPQGCCNNPHSNPHSWKGKLTRFIG